MSGMIILILFQEPLLDAVNKTLPGLDNQYEHLTNALDSTRHQLTVKDIHVPNDQDLGMNNYFVKETKS